VFNTCRSTVQINIIKNNYIKNNNYIHGCFFIALYLFLYRIFIIIFLQSELLCAYYEIKSLKVDKDKDIFKSLHLIRASHALFLLFCYSFISIMYLFIIYLIIFR